MIAEKKLLKTAKRKRFIHTQNVNLAAVRRDACDTTYSGPVNQNTRKYVRHLTDPKQYSAAKFQTEKQNLQTPITETCVPVGFEKENFPPVGVRGPRVVSTAPDPVTVYGVGKVGVKKFKLSSFVSDPALKAKLQGRGE